MNTVNFPNKAEIEERSAEWVAAMDRGLTAAEKKELESWLHNSPLHAETLIRTASTWDLLDVLQPIASLLPLETDSQAASTLTSYTANNKQASSEAASKPPKRPSTVFGWKPLAAAAAALVAVAVLLLYPAGFEQDSAGPDTVADNTLAPDETYQRSYKTEVGQSLTVTLPDETQVNLNTDTELAIQFSDSHRKVNMLRGEAYFHVAKNPQAPFQVTAADNSVTAIGTAFNIEINDSNNVEVIVTEGKIQLDRIRPVGAEQASDASRSVYMSVGDKVVVKPSGDRSAVSKSDDIAAELSWREGRLIFQGEPLKEVVAEINRYTRLQFRITDADIANIPVGGFFRTGDTAQLLRVLEQNFSIVSQRSGSEIRLARRTP